MDKSYKTIVLTVFLIFNIAFAQGGLKFASKIPPLIKSAVMPGWGEYALNQNSRGNFFLTAEFLGIALTTFSIVKSNNNASIYRAIAADHAQVNVGAKNHQFWVDIGNYNSQIDYNDEHLRWREFDNLYPSDGTWNWEWDTEKNRKEFEDLRIESDKLKLAGKFFIGGIVLNHIISVIDVYFLKNIALKEKIELSSYFISNNNALVYSIQFNL